MTDMIKAIVYTSNTGTTAQYANLIGKRTGLPVYSLDKAKTTLEKASDIIYLGWLMAGTVKGMKKAQKLWTIRAVCAVGMGETGSQMSDVTKQNSLSPEIAVFTLRGGFDIDKLHGIYRFMMKTMQKTAGKALANKADRTPDEDIMLDMMQNGRNLVSEDNLSAFYNWYDGFQKTGESSR